LTQIDTKRIAIEPHDLETVRAILAMRVPEYEVRVFGSRVRGTARPTSDLDLAVMTDKSLDSRRRTDLKDDFTESNLPFKVDVVDWAATDEAFRRIIGESYAVIQEAAPRRAAGGGR
jgi:predicted nucleotidyltransferase